MMQAGITIFMVKGPAECLHGHMNKRAALAHAMTAIAARQRIEMRPCGRLLPQVCQSSANHGAAMQFAADSPSVIMSLIQTTDGQSVVKRKAES